MYFEVKLIQSTTERNPGNIDHDILGCVRVVAFHPRKKLIFLVGTVEGKILKCSVNYASKFQAVRTP